jgi:hypothetical protein
VVQQQILIAAKHLGLIASLVTALGPMASVARCCCFGEQVRQSMGLSSQVDRCCVASLPGALVSAPHLTPQHAERSCCQTRSNEISPFAVSRGSSASESAVKDACECQCERACQATEVAWLRAQPKSEELPRMGAGCAVMVGVLARLPVGVLPAWSGSAHSVSFLSAQDRCVLLCRWLN